MVGQLCQWNLTQLATLSTVSKQEWWVWCSVYRLLLIPGSQSMKYCPPHFEWDIIPQLIPSENCRHTGRDCDMPESSHWWSPLFLCWRSPGWDTSVIYRWKTAWCGLCEECRLLGTLSPTISKPQALQLCKCLLQGCRLCYKCREPYSYTDPTPSPTLRKMSGAGCVRSAGCRKHGVLQLHRTVELSTALFCALDRCATPPRFERKESSTGERPGHQDRIQGRAIPMKTSAKWSSDEETGTGKLNNPQKAF